MVPTLTVSMIKGPFDMMSIQTGSQSGEFNAYITVRTSSGLNTIGPIKSQKGLIDRCLLRVEKIKLEFFDLPISIIEQTFAINIKGCEHTLRKLFYLNETLV